MGSAERPSAGGEERGAADVGACSSAAQSAAERENYAGVKESPCQEGTEYETVAVVPF